MPIVLLGSQFSDFSEGNNKASTCRGTLCWRFQDYQSILRFFSCLWMYPDSASQWPIVQRTKNGNNFQTSKKDCVCPRSIPMFCCLILWPPSSLQECAQCCIAVVSTVVGLLQDVLIWFNWNAVFLCYWAVCVSWVKYCGDFHAGDFNIPASCRSISLCNWLVLCLTLTQLFLQLFWSVCNYFVLQTTLIQFCN